MEEDFALFCDVGCEWFRLASVEDAGNAAAAAGGIASDLAENIDRESLAQVFEQVAKVSAEEATAVAAAAVKRNLAGAPAATRKAAMEFLTAVPEQIRATFRRPTDPRGLTIPPGLSLASPEVLAVALAGHRPRFKPGQRPLPNVDLELESLLGVGGFGEVWKARNPMLPGVPPVAVKFCTDPQAARLLQHEAAVLARVMRAGAHPNIVALRHTYLSTDPPALEYEYVGGGNLGELLAKWHAKGSGLSATQAVAWLAQVVGAVAFAHSQKPPIVHRDLKPSNILVERLPDGKARLRVADFGIGGVAAGLSSQTTKRSRGGTLLTVLHGSYTPLYASPQQQAGGPPDPRDDVYALGVIWYQMLVGDPAGGAPTGRRWTEALGGRGVPAGHIDLLARCVEPKADDRPKDARELARALDTAAGVPAGEKPTPAATVATPILVTPIATHAMPADRVTEPQRERSGGSRRGLHPDPLSSTTHSVRLAGLLRDLISAYRRRDAGWFSDWRVRLAGILGLPILFLLALMFGGIVTSSIDGAWAFARFGGPSGFVGLVVGYLLWRRSRGRAAAAQVESLTEQIVEDYPQPVEDWGGAVVLDRADTVRRMLREIER